MDKIIADVLTALTDFLGSLNLQAFVEEVIAYISGLIN